ncbi:Hypothetical protein POVR1_LOCUS551 [uncultured virus]|nr:Hypothetical protein POVR1_LOCUS551 [uncultured virus]
MDDNIRIEKISELISINDEKDIDNLYSRCISSDAERIKFTTSNVYNWVTFIKAGFLPSHIEFRKAIFEYIQGKDLETIEFWFSESGYYELDHLPVNTKWYFDKINLQLRDAARYGRSYALTLYAPEFIYKSFRPKTDMSIFRGPGSRIISPSQIESDKISIDGEKWNVLPVTRYAAGMSRSLFFNDTTGQKYCGTFYYLEPESTTLLAYKTSVTFFNKTHAMMHLDPEWNVTSKEKFITENPNIADHINGILPPNLMMTPMEYFLHNLNTSNPHQQDPYYHRRLKV